MSQGNRLGLPPTRRVHGSGAPSPRSRRRFSGSGAAASRSRRAFSGSAAAASSVSPSAFCGSGFVPSGFSESIKSGTPRLPTVSEQTRRARVTDPALSDPDLGLQRRVSPHVLSFKVPRSCRCSPCASPPSLPRRARPSCSADGRPRSPATVTVSFGGRARRRRRPPPRRDREASPFVAAMQRRELRSQPPAVHLRVLPGAGRRAWPAPSPPAPRISPPTSAPRSSSPASALMHRPRPRMPRLVAHSLVALIFHNALGVKRRPDPTRQGSGNTALFRSP